MKFRNEIQILICLLISFVFCQVQSEAVEAEIFTIEELKEDFVQMRKILEEDHANLYEYTEADSFNKLFEQQFKLIDHPMNLSDFFKILTPIVAKVGCGHTNVWMPNEYWNSEPDKLFPLKLKMIESNIVVTGSYNNDPSIPNGSIILAINGRPIEDIFSEMKKNYYSDAFIENFILSQVERRFSLIYARRFGFPDKFTITYAPLENKISKTEDIKPANIKSVREVVFQNFNHPELKFEIIDEKSVALMTIQTFIYYDKVAMFKEFLENSFKEIKEKNIANLILDLRGNDGGDPFCAAPLLSYLISKPVPYYAEPYGKYSELAKPIPLAENRFDGNLFTLIDGRCFSTNGHFCSLLKYHKIGEFVGIEGGASYKCNAGKNTHFSLNNTRIILYIGRSTYEVAVKNMDKKKGILPDHYVEQTYEDYLKDKDTTLEFTLELIEQRN